MLILLYGAFTMAEVAELDYPDFEDCTRAFIDKFRGSELASGLVNRAGLSEQDALAQTVMMQASGHMPIGNRGQKAEGLSGWHTWLRAECSATYARLGADNPEMSRGEVNAIPELSDLNGVRRGMRMAMRESYASADPTKDPTKYVSTIVVSHAK